MLVYISGMHECIETDMHVREEFNHVAKIFKDSGFEVINPAGTSYRNNLKQNQIDVHKGEIIHKSLSIYAGRGTDILQGLVSILIADKVVFLKNSETSRQAAIEMMFCEALNKDVTYFP